ncbi:MAG TPA: hypothetical protein VMT86_04830 [Bryobacteraceae bacterium]|nr:hypothetical protein [Bryobacteraceae bacterium]
MPDRIWHIFLSALSLIGLAGAQSPGPDQLARFQEKVRQDITGIPNYTCLETVERAHRDAHTRSFKPVDTVRIEVSSVGGKELFAWPGSHHFEDRDVTALVGGTIGSGLFNMFAHRLFVDGAGVITFSGYETIDGRRASRYDFHNLPGERSLRLTAGDVTEAVPVKGSFWFDPVSLDLLRLDVHGDALPYSLRLEEAVMRMTYMRVHMGDSNVLLPQRSEFEMTHFSGESNRDVIDFSACREYGAQSTISFDAPASLPEAPKKPVREVRLPAALLLSIGLETVIDSKTAAVGDTLHARVLEEVHSGDVAVPAGAEVMGHIRKLDRSSPSAPYTLAIDISEIEWAGAHAVVQAALVDVDRKSAGVHLATYFDGHATKVVIEGGIPGAGIIFVNGGKFRIPAGLRMTWRTLAPAGEQPRSGSGRIEE